VVRLGLLANVTHAPALVAIHSGRLVERLRPLRLETRVFRAGPRVVEALVGTAIDVGLTGPAPVVFTRARHGAASVVIVSGHASGGASLVAIDPSVRGVADLRGKRVAVVQLGTTQDVSLRAALAREGLRVRDDGGDVTLVAFGGPTIKLEMARGALAAAWMPEPWASRLVLELGARRVLDERELWPERRFSSALVATRGAFLQARRDDVARVLEALDDELSRANRDRGALTEGAYQAVQAMTRGAGPKRAWTLGGAHVDFSRDPLERAIGTFAEQARAAGFVKSADTSGLFEPVGRPEPRS
jgi:NitT/TauT family transport system substrate-binding protein